MIRDPSIDLLAVAGLRCVFVLLAVGLLAGCQLIPPRETSRTESPAAVSDARSGQSARLVDVMDALQNGDFAAAATLLEALRHANPGSSTLSLLQQQLTEPPESLLPPPYRSFRVQPGDTLSEIAERELGNPLLFVALARLNGLAEPRRLSVGSELRVPVRTDESDAATAMPEDEDIAVAESADPETSEPIRRPPDDTRRSELETVAEYLLASGQPTDARELLLAAGVERNLSPGAEELLAELSLDSARAEADDGQFDAALATLTEAAAALPAGLQRARLDARRTRIAVLERLAAAEVLEQQGQLIEAYTAVDRALELEADFAPAVQREAALRTMLVDDYHDLALRAWRARDIDLAIRTWSELVEVIPDFEPARIYLDRARQLRRRLDAPE